METAFRIMEEKFAKRRRRAKTDHGFVAGMVITAAFSDGQRGSLSREPLRGKWKALAVTESSVSQCRSL